MKLRVKIQRLLRRLFSLLVSPVTARSYFLKVFHPGVPIFLG